VASYAREPAGLGGSTPTPGGLDPNPTQGSQVQTAGQVVPYTGRVVRFNEYNATREVPYKKEAVNEQARVYANQGKKLSVKGSGHFIWQDCFDILIRTKQSTVQVFTAVQPIIGKRHFNQDLPDDLQPKRKEAFDFEMEESEGEI
jgi:hypothetical protein